MDIVSHETKQKLSRLINAIRYFTYFSNKLFQRFLWFYFSSSQANELVIKKTFGDEDESFLEPLSDILTIANLRHAASNLCRT